MQKWVTNSQWYAVAGLVGLGLPLMVTISITRVSIMVSVKVAFNKYRCEFVTRFCIFMERKMLRFNVQLKS